eukprot:TRINITY_DN8217_c0_g1_i1.p1 TRINITY_DN8217_c0_g1~~TRINITY_DN8217_c0_g1_i1.p1  ORF type:complete len:203 (+),score=42.84 TRINITY_DN8217_c0_g1_i1:62-670(+)
MGQEQSQERPSKPPARTGYSAASVARGADEDGELVDPKFLVVSKGVTQKDEDPELTLLQSTPTFYPLLKSSLGTGLFGNSDDAIDVLSPKPLIEMCVRMQDHMNRSARYIHGEQQALHRSMSQLTSKLGGTRNQLPVSLACCSTLSATDVEQVSRFKSAIRLKAANQASEVQDLADLVEETQQRISGLESALKDIERLLPQD